MSKSVFSSSILITGGTAGLGYQAALSIARQCPQSLIIIAARSNTDKASTRINNKLKQTNVKFMSLDLSTLATVRNFASSFLAANHPPISALVLNAGIQLPDGIEYTTDGIEKHFAINHVAHALLFHLLLPILTPTARILVVASGVHDPVQGKPFGINAAYTSAAEVAAPNEAQIKASNGRDRYATSKAANVIWALALGRRMAAHPKHAGKTVLAFDPGLMFGTSLSRDAGAFLRFVNAYIVPHTTRLMRAIVDDNINTPAESGGNLAWLVLGKEMQGRLGVYCEKRKERESSVQSREAGVQDELWEWTVERVARGEEERRVFGRS
ncbi:dehydrogenase/reductase [Setomelanomma holmii]|uniref:Dehydrogenase/reductase n=1 Tax=Setomelanomma holmii TaxID=210430 RepID=A0A9P4LLT1_9PLEO|nr:dehydrogenase/reductase [Setomelanomma holmii]